MATSTRLTIRIGVFAPSSCQILDMACVDIFGMMSIEYLSFMKDMLPAHLLSLAPSISFYYISALPAGSPLLLTAGMSMVTTHHLSDPEVGPGRLDVVLVPGPDPSVGWDQDVLQWLSAQSKSEGTGVLCICTGIFICGEAGLLDGRTACGPRGIQSIIKKKWPSVTLVGEKLRWVQDGNFWSSGKFIRPDCSISDDGPASGRNRS
jgi:transcriptional regulator GlxA family with amidase domain